MPDQSQGHIYGSLAHAENTRGGLSVSLSGPSITYSRQVQEYTIYEGRALVTKNTSRSLTLNQDGTWSNTGWNEDLPTEHPFGDDYEVRFEAQLKTLIEENKAPDSPHVGLVIVYTYKNGQLDNSNKPIGRGSFISINTQGQISAGDITQNYKIIHGQAVITSNVTRTWSSDWSSSGSYDVPVPSEGSWSRSSNTVSYTYDAHGKQTGQSGNGTSLSYDGAIYTAGSTTQTYEKTATGYIRLKQTVSRSWTSNANEEGSYDQPIGSADGSANWNRQTITTTYTYDSTTGEQTAQSGTGKSLSFDAGSQRYTGGNIFQTYEKIAGQFRMTQTTQETFGSNEEGEGSLVLPERDADGSFSTQRITTFLSYNTTTGSETGRRGEGQGLSRDENGQLTRSVILQEYLPNDSTKISKSKTYSWGISSQDDSAERIKGIWDGKEKTDVPGYSYSQGRKVYNFSPTWLKQYPVSRRANDTWSKTELITQYHYDSDGILKTTDDGITGSGITVAGKGRGLNEDTSVTRLTQNYRYDATEKGIC